MSFEMDYLIRFAQQHETFRRPEIEALAVVGNLDIEFLYYSENSPYSIVKLKNEAAAKALISCSISSKGIYELWGTGTTYDDLHEDVRARSSHLWPQYKTCTFRFQVDTFSNSRTLSEQIAIITSFKYLGFTGPIKMKLPNQTFTIFEEYSYGNPTLKKVHLTRFIAPSSRRVIDTYTLKKRAYINTTSMDSELALLTANITLAAPHKIFYDPFVGTGSLPIACSHFGARTLGSDIDGRMLRGREGKDIRTNFVQYGILGNYLDGFISDLTHTPLRSSRILDGIICDPPYGVREGLKVLGTKDGSGKEVVFIDGEAAHLRERYVPPKRAYSFEVMLEDVLEFAAGMLVDEGRLSLWMPTANDEVGDMGMPEHHALELVSVCAQTFTKWSRRLMTYRRLPVGELKSTLPKQTEETKGTTANDLNSFRKRYFEGFKTPPINGLPTSSAPV